MSYYYDEDVKKYGENVAPQLPWSIQLNPTYGCNRAPLRSKQQPDGSCKGGCNFCGIWSLIDHEKDTIEFRYMTVETATVIAKQLNDWVPGRRIEINNFGEPFLNPDIFKIIKALRDNYPSCCIQLQTNGVNCKESYEIFKDMSSKFFEAGGNMLVFDSYEGTYPTYLEFSKKFKEETGIGYIDYIYDNPDHVSYYANHGTDYQKIFVVEDLEITSKGGTARAIYNHAGNLNPEVFKKYNIPVGELPMDKKCSRVFREIIVGYDGTVSMCCHDFRRQLVLGKVPEDNVRDIWNSREFNTLRKLLYDKDRTKIRPCNVCSYPGGFRLGFLHRPVGEVTQEDYDDLVSLQKKYSDLIHFNGYAEVNGVRVNSTMKRK